MAKKKKNSNKGNQPVDAPDRAWYTPSYIRDFYYEVVAEFKKIVWPDRKVTIGLSGFVIVLTVVLSLYLGSVDFILGKLVGLVLQ